MAVFVTSAQLYNAAHDTAYKPLPSSTDGCDAMNITIVDKYTVSNIPIESSVPSTSASILQTSFQWYPLIGATIVWLVAIVMSHTIAPNWQTIDAKLLSPLVRWRLQADGGQHTEMTVINVTKCSQSDADENVYAVK